MQRFAVHRAGLVGAFVIFLFLTAGTLAPLIAPHDPTDADVLRRLEPPSPEYWLGTDGLGRDILSRLIYGSGISLRVSLSVVIVGVLIGVPIGSVSAYVGGRLDLTIQRLVDILQAFPGILLLILVVALVGPSLDLAIASLGLLSAPAYARLIRAMVLQVREFAYVESARTVGCRPVHVLLRHILPNSIAPVIVHSSLRAATSLVLLAGLGFLGLGAQPPTPEWGAMLAEGKIYMRSASHVVIAPGLAVSVVVLGLNLVGDALRDAFDPRSVRENRR